MNQKLNLCYLGRLSINTGHNIHHNQVSQMVQYNSKICICKRKFKQSREK